MEHQGNAFTFVAIAWIFLIGGILLWDGAVTVEFTQARLTSLTPTAVATGQNESVTPEIAAPAENQTAFRAPYVQYFVTQGLHGFSYGQMAVDISGGKGAEIISPINGEVTAFYIDQSGNTTLIIENQVYQVTLLHGLYEVNIGDQLTIGQRIGMESNQGYTLDMQGNPCWGRDCGYHTHLNILDKRTGQNVDPFTLLQP
ncbi:MAG: hypothetical protein HPY59_04755 [Anaerolineae bacterium]|nr:hypothetical protein [Anaerolineae bacterium]